MSFFPRKTAVFKLFSMFLMCFCLLGCAEEVENVGYVAKLKDIQSIEKGMSKDEVASILGSPASISNIGGDSWIYTGGEFTKETFFQPEIRTYSSFIINFDGSQKVSSLVVKGIDNMNEIEFSEDFTRTGGNEVTFVQQLLGNLGKYNSGGRVSGQ